MSLTPFGIMAEDGTHRAAKHADFIT